MLIKTYFKKFSINNKLNINPIPIKLSYSITNKDSIINDNKYIIFLHGLFGNKNNFRGFTYHESIKSKRNPIIVDLRNHGSSDSSESITYDEMAYDINNLINELQIKDKVTLVGHSMGGKVAMKYSCLFPDKVDGLFIIDTLPKSISIQEETSQNVVKLLKLINSIDLTNKSRNDVIQIIYNEFGGTVANLINTNLISDPDLKWRINHNILLNQLENILSWQDNGIFEGPIRILNGERSMRFYIDDFKSSFPNIKMRDIRIIHGAGHWVHTDKAEETLEEIRKFIIEIDSQKDKI